MMRRTADQTGFTLIELVMVIVLLGIIGVSGVDFINRSFRGFSDTDSRLEIFEEGKIALARMERELQSALPNAVDLVLAGDDIRFGMIDVDRMARVMGRYSDSQQGTSEITDVSNALLAPGPPDPLPLILVSIYNRSWGNFTSLDIAGGRRLYRVTSLAAAPVMTLDRDIIDDSPGRRYYAVDRAVRYRLVNGRLMRSQYLIAGQNVDINTELLAGPEYALATGVTALTFGYTASTLINNALITIQLTLQRDAELVTFNKEIHIRNVP